MRTAAAWLPLVAVLLVSLGALTLLVRWVEPKLAFFPLRGEDRTPASYGIDHHSVTVTTGDGEQLRLWRLPHPTPLAEIVYSHGNGGNLSLWSDVLAGLHQQGFSVVAVDYRGYGLSSGRPSEEGLYRDVDATIAFATRDRPDRNVPLIYWGRSLGSTLAAYAASRLPPSGVVLEAGFPTVRSVLETNPVLWILSWLSSYRLPTAEWMSVVRQPVLVLHGDHDSVIPYRLGQRLFASLPGPKTFVTIHGGDHNDAVPADPEAYWTAVRRFAENLRAPR